MTDYVTSRTGEPDPIYTATTSDEAAHTMLLNRISWGAVFAGVVVLVVQLLLSMLGIGVGVATLNPGTADNPAVSTFSIAAGIWYVVSGIIASFVGGYIAGRLSGRPVKSTASIHGLTTWAAATLVIFYLLTTALGGIIGGVFSGISSAVGGLGQAAGTVAKTAAPSLANASDPLGAIEQQLRQATGGNDPAALRDAAISAMRASLTGDQAQAKDAQERAAQALSRAENISIEDARTRIGQYEQQYHQAVDRAKQEATKAADAAAKLISRGALFGFIALVLGAIAAWFGGHAGTVAPTLIEAGLPRSARRRL